MGLYILSEFVPLFLSVPQTTKAFYFVLAEKIHHGHGAMARTNGFFTYAYIEILCFCDSVQDLWSFYPMW